MLAQLLQESTWGDPCRGACFDLYLSFCFLICNTISFNICHSFRARVFLFANVEMVVQALYCNFCLQSANSFSVTRFYISMVKIESVSMWPLVLVFHGTWKKLGITPLRFTYSTFFCADDCLSFFMPI